MPNVLVKKKAVIVGGSRGIGRTIASAFLKEGAELLLVARSEKELEETQGELLKFGRVEMPPAAFLV